MEADQLTNEDFTGFPSEDRVEISLEDVDLKVLCSLVKTRNEFVVEKELQKEIAKAAGISGKKRFDKTPW